MIAATFLYHSNDFIAFWLLVALLNKVKVRCFFEPEMPGFTKHVHIMNSLVFDRLGTLNQHFIEQEFQLSMVINSWFFSLFTIVIPMDSIIYFYHFFFKEGWPFFHKFILHIL